MGNYIHHVPGRIRVRVPSVKRNEKEAQAVQGLLEGIEGVSVVSVSTVTSSVTINYDARMVSSTAIMETLRHQNYFNWETATTDSKPSPGAAAKAGEIFGKTIFGVIMEKAIEQSATALIAAMI
jgi:copper chaperone CopZ